METANSTVIVSNPVPIPAPTSIPSPAIAQNKSLQGSVLVLIQFDVCEEINLDALRDIFGARRQEASFKHPAPGYVRFERAPVVEASECCERPLESVRGHVVRQRAATGDRERSAPRIAPVAAKERRSRFSVAASRPPYEVPVTGFTHSSAVLYERAAFARPARGILPG